MAFEQKENSGVLFRNDKREKETQPHHTGKALIDGKLYYISAWLKEGSIGKFQSLAFKAVDQQMPSTRKPYAENKPSPLKEALDDGDIPF